MIKVMVGTACKDSPTWVVQFYLRHMPTQCSGTENKEEAFDFAKKMSKDFGVMVDVFAHGRIHSKVYPNGRVDSSWQYRSPR